MLTETPNPPWPRESPDSSWLPWIYHGHLNSLPSVLETICALSASCVSVSSRSQSLPGVSSAPPWWAACPVCSALVGVCLVCSALVGVCLVCSALVGVCLVCSALVGVLPRLLRPGGRLPRLLRPGGRLPRLLRPGGRLASSAPPWWAPASSAPPWWAACLVCSALVGACPARVTSRLR